MKYTYLALVKLLLLISHIDYENFKQEFFKTVKQLFFENEYQKTLDYVSLNIPNFFLKYPGYEISLFKLIIFEMIKENKPRSEIMLFYSNEYLNLINKYDNPFSNDICLFNYLIDNADIFKSKIYELSLEDCYLELEKGFKICFMIFFGLKKTNYNVYMNEKVLFLYDINLLTNFEGHIINKYENFQTEKLNNIKLINSQNYLFYDFFPDSIDNDLNNNNFFFPYNKFPPLESFSSNKNDDNTNNVLNTNLFFTSKEDDSSNNFIRLENKKRYRTSKLSTSSKTSSNKNTSFSIQKTKIKEYQFRTCKRENIDKKILRRFNKFLKIQNKQKINIDIMNYINNSEFFQDYIKYNLMPPFEYKEENVIFKSFNTKYLLWFFGHKYSFELYNIFIENCYDDILELITKTWKFNQNFDELNLLRSYIHKMPNIFGPIEEERHDSNEINYEENDSSGNNSNSYFNNKSINLEESEDQEKNKDNKGVFDYNLINDEENYINDNNGEYFLGQLQITNNNFFINKNDNNFENNDDFEENNNHTLFQQDFPHLTCQKI